MKASARVKKEGIQEFEQMRIDTCFSRTTDTNCKELAVNESLQLGNKDDIKMISITSDEARDIEVENELLRIFQESKKEQKQTGEDNAEESMVPILTDGSGNNLYGSDNESDNMDDEEGEEVMTYGKADQTGDHETKSQKETDANDETLPMEFWGTQHTFDQQVEAFVDPDKNEWIEVDSKGKDKKRKTVDSSDNNPLVTPGEKPQENKEKESVEVTPVDSNKVKNVQIVTVEDEMGKRSLSEEVMYQRGRSMIERVVQRKLAVTAEIRIPKRATTMSPRFKIMKLLEAGKKLNASFKLITKGGTYQNEMEIPMDTRFSEEFCLKEARNMRRLILKFTILTNLTLHDMKSQKDKDVWKVLDKENMWLTLDKWGTRPSAKIGFISNVHPLYVWKESMKETMTKALDATKMSGYNYKKWLQRNRASKSPQKNHTPRFELFQEKKSFGNGPERVTSSVLIVQTAIEDAQYLKELINKAEDQNLMPFKFVPTGIHLSTLDKHLKRILNSQNRFLNSTRMIPMIGLKESTALKYVKMGEEKVTVLEYVRRQLRAKAIERTNQTQKLGKWWIITSDVLAKLTRQKMDRDFPRIFEKVLVNDDDKIPGMEFPRHPQSTGSVRGMDTIIRRLEEEYRYDTNEELVELKTTPKRRQMPTFVDVPPSQVSKKKQKKSYAEMAGSIVTTTTSNMTQEPTLTEDEIVDIVEAENENMLDKFREEAKQMDDRFRAELQKMQNDIGNLLLASKRETVENLKAMKQLIEDTMESLTTFKKEIQQQMAEILEVVNSLAGQMQQGKRTEVGSSSNQRTPSKTRRSTQTRTRNSSSTGKSPETK